MDNSSFSIHPIQTIHFLSVFTYMNSLSDIFYTLHLIEVEERYQPFPIINAIFEYLDENVEEEGNKKNLIRRLLQNSDLHGGGVNETLDLKYINANFEYIISNVVFSRYGNIHGYLAKTLSRRKNMTFFSLRQEISKDLMNLEFMNEDGSVSYLSFGAIKGIIDTLIMPLFPKSEENIRVIDVDYIYAQAGWMLARSTMINSTDFTFEEFISMSQTIELSASQNDSYQSALQIFTLPALLFYAQQENESFGKQTVAHSMKKQDFWIKAFQDLFAHLRESLETTSRKELESSPVYQFALAMKNFKNRTSIARESLKDHCPGIPDNSYEPEIEAYKFWASCSYCSGDAVFGLPFFGELLFSYKLLPNIDDVYSAQFGEIERKYQSYAKVLIRGAFQEANLIDIINSSDTTVFHDWIVPETSPYGYGSILKEPVFGPNKQLLTVNNSGSQSFLVLINNQHNITLLRYESRENFLKAFGLSVKRTKIQESTLKSPTESFEDLENKIADRLAKDFRKALYALGYDKTTGEKVLDSVLMFVPFYDCITNVRKGDDGKAIVACMGDIAMLVPFGAQLASVGSKMSTLAARSLVAATGVSVRTLTLRHAIRLAMQVGPTKVLAGSIALVEKEILTKQMFKSLSLGLIRSVDPGFELLGKSLWKGSSKLVDLFHKVWQNAEKSPSISSKLSSLKKIWDSLKNRLKTMKDGKFVVPSTHIRCKRTPTRPSVIQFAGACTSREVHRDIYPGGVNPHGPQLVQSFAGHIVELRQTIYLEEKIPVIRTRLSMFGEVYYRPFNVKLGRPIGLEMKLNHQGVLEPVFKTNLGSIRGIRTELSEREKLRFEKEESIEEAAAFISKRIPHISKEKARDMMNRHILAPVLPPSADPNWQISTSNRPGVTQYTGDVVPTYQDFAFDLVNNKGLLSNVYRNWFVDDPQQLNELLYRPHFEQITVDRLKEADDIIAELYGRDYEERLDVDLRQIVIDYAWNKAWNHVNFADFFAIRKYVKNNYVEMKNDEKANKLLHIALYRLALRQGIDGSVEHPRKLYMLHSESAVKPFPSEILRFKDHMVTPAHFQLVSSAKPQGHSTIIKIAEKHPNKRLISFLIQLDSGFPIANINSVFRTVRHRCVILPNTKFGLKFLRRHVSSPLSFVTYFQLFNLPIQKEIWMRDIIRELETLQGSLS